MKSIFKFTDREIDILKLLIAGLSNPEIAKELNISVHTVKAHIASMYFKSGINSRVLLAIKAYKLGVLQK